MPSLRPNEKNITVFVSNETYNWISAQAKEHGRARCREVNEIIELAKRRDSRRSNPIAKSARCGV